MIIRNNVGNKLSTENTLSHNYKYPTLISTPKRKESNSAPHTNAKMSEFHVAMGICNLRHIEESIAARKKVCEAYDAALWGVAGLKILKRVEGVVSNYAYYPILVEGEFSLTRDELADVLREQEIFSRKYFYPIVTEFSCYKGMYPFAEDSVAKYVSERILCLPLYDTMTDESVVRVLDTIIIQ